VKANLSQVLSKFHPDMLSRYDFAQAVYHGALARMTGIMCPEHGEFSQYPAQLRKNGSGCPDCGDVIRRAKRRSPQDEVIRQATERHAGAYSYERAVYVNSVTKFTVTCPQHGDFSVAPNNHISGGKGCPACGALRRGHRKDVTRAARKTADAKIFKFAAKFIASAQAVHGDSYDYSSVEYAGQQTKVTILCPEHGPFQQSPEHHVKRAQGCPECSHHRSRGEAAALAFVSIFAGAETRNRKIIAPKELDIYVPSAALAIEYCGEYWHGASSVEDERTYRLRHLEKYRACAAVGIRLLTVYESEWQSRTKPIKRLIRAAIGKARGRLMARKCDLRRVEPGEASGFFEAYHPQGGKGAGDHYGLYWGKKLVACMRFSFGNNDRGAHSEPVWTLSRYATRVSVVGGASRLFSAFVKEVQPKVVKSFSDNRYFAGGMYGCLGFVMEEESDPDYQVYHPKTGLLPKTAWQRRKIPTRIAEIGAAETFDPATDLRSERDMTYLLGAQRVFDCGKKRWVWRAS
jgi:hypothetical protein